MIDLKMMSKIGYQLLSIYNSIMNFQFNFGFGNITLLFSIDISYYWKTKPLLFEWKCTLFNLKIEVKNAQFNV